MKTALNKFNCWCVRKQNGAKAVSAVLGQIYLKQDTPSSDASFSGFTLASGDGGID